MQIDRSDLMPDGATLLTAYAVGTFGVVVYVLTLFVQFSQEPGSASTLTTAGYWSALLGTPLLAALGAGNLASTGTSDLIDSLVGFGVGGVVYGGVVGWMNWSVAGGATANSGLTWHVLFTLAAMFSVAVAAVLGALLGARIGNDDPGSDAADSAA
jgi:hypothetical protein